MAATYDSKEWVGFPISRIFVIARPNIHSCNRSRTTAGVTTAIALPASIDLSQWCSPVENQGSLGSCTANTAVGLYEYFERSRTVSTSTAHACSSTRHARNLLHWTGDSGAFIRTAMGALVLFGVAPEEYWPYDITQVDTEPPAFCYALAKISRRCNTYASTGPPQ